MAPLEVSARGITKHRSQGQGLSSQHCLQRRPGTATTEMSAIRRGKLGHRGKPSADRLVRDFEQGQGRRRGRPAADLAGEVAVVGIEADAATLVHALYLGLFVRTRINRELWG